MDANERAVAISAALERLSDDSKRACTEIAEALSHNPMAEAARGSAALRALASTLRASADGQIGDSDD